MSERTRSSGVPQLPIEGHTDPSSGSGDLPSNASSPTNSSNSSLDSEAQGSALARASYGTWHAIQPGLVFVSRHISPFAWRLVLLWAKLILVGLSVVSVTVSALILYWVVHWLVIPKQLHSFPVYFDYSTTPACAAVSFSNRQWFDTAASRPALAAPVLDLPAPSVDYDVTLALDLPSNHYNVDKGPVMVDITLYGMKGRDEPTARSRRPLLLPYRSSLLGTMREWLMIVPALLGWTVDEFTVTMPLFEELNVEVYESSNFPLLSATVCMSPPLQVYRADLRFHSQLSGIRYLLSSHPIIMCVVFCVARSYLGLLGGSGIDVVVVGLAKGIPRAVVLHRASLVPLVRRVFEVAAQIGKALRLYGAGLSIWMSKVVCARQCPVSSVVTMPFVALTTNVQSILADPNKAASVMTDTVAEALGKPKKYMTVQIVPATGFVVGGEVASGVSVEIYSIGGGLKGPVVEAVYGSPSEGVWGSGRTRAYTSQLGGYWESVRGMPRRAWDWSRRNKRWIFGGVAAGAVAIYWLRPYYQQFRELQSIVSEANRIMEEGEEGKAGEPKVSKRQKEHHARVMAMANNLILAGDSIDRLSVWLRQAYDDDIDTNIPRKLKALKGPEMAREKQRLFAELQKLFLGVGLSGTRRWNHPQRAALPSLRNVECSFQPDGYSIDSAAHATSHAEGGTVGWDGQAAPNGPPSELNAELAAYLKDVSDHLTSPLVLCLVDNASREACGQRLPSPTSRETASGIESTIQTVVEAALQGLLVTGSETPRSAMVVPPLEEGASGHNLATETTDLVDSPHFDALLRESMRRACEKLSKHLCDGLSLDDDTKTVALAKTIPHVNKAIESSVLVKSESNAYLIQFNELDCIREFSDMIYYRSEEADNSRVSSEEGEPAGLEAIMQALAEAAEEERSSAKA
ncbi:hypothetical protein FOZ60_002735 [Perkinsus olseni]|uniref:Uncharacterized protein n=1 Tax=Perkinsus olseni TaxID=32597 RepID=A0A7J6PIK0_PEROL|nr:hypothetical protein FOZ60_002735 [Perkinsus olseni]